jgi:opacity protein-like surface antigen
MIALALALGLAASAGPDDTDLPRSLSVDETPFLAPAPVQKDEYQMWVGGHLGITDAYDAEDINFVFGANLRIKLMSWLAVEGTFDINMRQSFEDGQIHVSQYPFEFGALFYLPLELPVRPYGTAGIGFTFSNTTFNGNLRGLNDTTELNALAFLGFGVEWEVQDNVMLDANLRFIFVNDPPHFHGISANWLQLTFGVLFKLSK